MAEANLNYQTIRTTHAAREAVSAHTLPRALFAIDALLG